MAYSVVALWVGTPLLYLFTLSRPAGRLKTLLNLLTAICTAAAAVLYILLQHASGGPDAVRELEQLYIPCGIFLILAVRCLVTAGINWISIRAEREL